MIRLYRSLPNLCLLFLNYNDFSVWWNIHDCLQPLDEMIVLAEVYTLSRPADQLITWRRSQIQQKVSPLEEA